ncbi:MAG: hypothetical protein Q7R76_03475 [Candidatus Woesearchaeota archaeon]|nr:hypothetical protein [Candidatus Woesearchaeota archaeon]
MRITVPTLALIFGFIAPRTSASAPPPQHLADADSAVFAMNLVTSCRENGLSADQCYDLSRDQHNECSTNYNCVNLVKELAPHWLPLATTNHAAPSAPAVPANVLPITPPPTQPAEISHHTLPLQSIDSDPYQSLRFESTPTNAVLTVTKLTYSDAKAKFDSNESYIFQDGAGKSAPDNNPDIIDGTKDGMNLGINGESTPISLEFGNEYRALRDEVVQKYSDQLREVMIGQREGTFNVYRVNTIQELPTEAQKTLTEVIKQNMSPFDKKTNRTWTIVLAQDSRGIEYIAAGSEEKDITKWFYAHNEGYVTDGEQVNLLNPADSTQEMIKNLVTLAVEMDNLRQRQDQQTLHVNSGL